MVAKYFEYLFNMERDCTISTLIEYIYCKEGIFYKGRRVNQVTSRDWDSILIQIFSATNPFGLEIIL